MSIPKVSPALDKLIPPSVEIATNYYNTLKWGRQAANLDVAAQIKRNLYLVKSAKTVFDLYGKLEPLVEQTPVNKWLGNGLAPLAAEWTTRGLPHQIITDSDSWSRLVMSGPGGGLGGVYLDAVAEGFKQIFPLEGVSIDRENGRLIFLGAGEGSASLDLNLDDFAVALKSVAMDQWPGVSIDPDPVNAYSGTMYYRYIGPTEGARFGYIMGYADRLMKNIGLGEDNENPGRVIRPDLPGFKDQFELGAKHGIPGKTWSRFWIVPGDIRWESSTDGGSIWCRQASMKVKTEVMTLIDNRLKSAPDRTSPASEAFAEWFTRNYDQLAGIYPVYEQLRELAKLVSLADWLRKNLPPREFEALVECFQPESFPTPTTTPTLRRTRHRVGIFGGVDLQPPARSFTPMPSNRAEDITRAVEASMPVSRAPALGPVTVANIRRKALALPLARLHPRGTLTLSALDFPTNSLWPGFNIQRYYHSVDTKQRPFGRGWNINLPEIVTVRTEKKAVYRLTDSRRSFFQPFEDGDLARIFHHGGGLTLHGRDGSIWDFDRNGRMTRLNNNYFTLEYRYQGAIPEKMIRSGAGVEPYEILFHQKDGLVFLIEDNQGRASHYSYDDRQRLIAVRNGENLTRYTYDRHDHPVSMNSNGVQHGFKISPDGFLNEVGDGNSVLYQSERTLEEDGDETIRDLAGGGGESRFDPAGTLKTVRVGDWEEVYESRGDVVTHWLAVGGTTVSQGRLDPEKRLYTREIIGDRTSEAEYDENGFIRNITTSSENDASSMEIHFDRSGLLTSVSDPEGGVYQIGRGIRNKTLYFTTPTGAYIMENDARGRPVFMKTPGGKSMRRAYDRHGHPEHILIENQGEQLKWRRTPGPEDNLGQGWELRSADAVLRAVWMRNDGRKMIVKAGDLTAQAEQGEGGMKVARPDGTQALIRMDSAGRVVEAQEYPVGTRSLNLPLADITGLSKVKEKSGSMEKPLKRK